MVEDFNYDKFVVVAEEEWKMNYEYNPTLEMKIEDQKMVKLLATVGNIEWDLSFRNFILSNRLGTYEMSLELTCKSVAEHFLDEVHLEIHGYWGKTSAELNAGINPTPLRHRFKQSDNTLSLAQPFGDTLKGMIMFTARILKDRTALPDFKLESAMIGELASDVKLQIADQIFYVNKEVLSMHSNYFDRMFNGSFKESNQTEVELKHEQADPAVFEDFLLVLCVPDALPNRKNLSELFKLADYYKAENVREKCERHFRMCREMPVGERYMLALELGNKQMQNLIMDNVDLDKAKSIIVTMKEALANANRQRRQIGWFGGMMLRFLPFY